MEWCDRAHINQTNSHIWDYSAVTAIDQVVLQFHEAWTHDQLFKQ